MKTEILQVDCRHPEKERIEKAVKIIKNNGLVAFPTETVYGVAASFESEVAVAKLYEIKARPKDKPFTAHISDIRQLELLSCEISDEALKLTRIFWPGPLTVILKTKGGGTMGARMPDNVVALAVIARCGCPLALPSANLSGRKPPKNAAEVIANLDGKIELILDGGPADLGVESTVLDTTVTPYKVLRPGAIGKERITGALSKISVE